MKKGLVFVVAVIVSILFTFYYLGAEHPLVATVLLFLVGIKTKVIYLISGAVGKVMGFLAVSKGKILLFIKNMTLYKTVVLGTKRFIIDNVISKWLNDHVIKYFKKPVKELLVYYKKLNVKMKIKKAIRMIVPAGILLALASAGGFLEGLAIYAELKILVIGFFKFVWLIAGNVFGWVFNFLSGTWLGQIVEIFALAWLLTYIEKIPFVGKWVAAFFRNISKGIEWVFDKGVYLFRITVGEKTFKFVAGMSKRLADRFHRWVDKIKVETEESLMEGFYEEIVKVDPQAYFETTDVKSEMSKTEFYVENNKKTKDNIDIKAFFPLSKELKPVKDFLIVESVASDNGEGAGRHIRIRKNSFWALNLSDRYVVLKSKNGCFKPKSFNGVGLRLITPACSGRYDFSDLELVVQKVGIVEVVKIPTPS